MAVQTPWTRGYVKLPTATNSQTGQTYTTIPAPGGSYHVYADGRKVFVKAGAPAPAAAAATPQDAGSQATMGDPKDATYYGQLAGNQTAYDTGIAQNKLGLDQARRVHDRALEEMGLQQPKDEYGLKVGANKQGLFYGGKLGQDLGDLAAQYVRRRGDTEAGLTDATRQAGITEAGLGATRGQADIDALQQAIQRALGMMSG